MKEELLAMLDARSHEDTKHLHDKLKSTRFEFNSRSMLGSSMYIHAIMRPCEDYMVAYVSGAIEDLKRCLESTEKKAKHSEMRDIFLQRLSAEKDAVRAVLNSYVGRSLSGLLNHELTNYKSFDPQWQVLDVKAKAESGIILFEVERAAPSLWELLVKRWQNNPVFVTGLAVVALVGGALAVTQAIEYFRNWAG